MDLGAHAQWQAWAGGFHGRVSCNLIIHIIIFNRISLGHDGFADDAASSSCRK